MRVELRDEAREDLVRGALFYLDQSPGLDDHFLECLRSDLKRLESNAGVHEQFQGFYRKLSQRFPFAIYYLVKDEAVDVVAILDCRNDPASTATRLGRREGGRASNEE
jgi:plasmid stabilization system protein ParE